MTGSRPAPILPRLVDRSIETATGCWEWQGATDRGGYGLISALGRWTRTHRAAYEVLVGPIPSGLQIDHLCRNKACWRPDHLEPVTGAENLRRAPEAVATMNARKTHCKHGHEFTPENTIVSRAGHRRCLTCGREYTRQRRQAARLAAEAAS